MGSYGTPRIRGQKIEEYALNTTEIKVSQWVEPKESDKALYVDLPGLIDSSTDGDWRKDSACLETELEFIPEVLSGLKAAALKEVCSKCLVKDECLTFAVTNKIEWGVYGGLTPKERKAL